MKLIPFLTSTFYGFVKLPIERIFSDAKNVFYCLKQTFFVFISVGRFSLKKELEIAKVICKPPVLVPKTAQKSSLSKIEETKRM